MKAALHASQASQNGYLEIILASWTASGDHERIMQDFERFDVPSSPCSETAIAFARSSRDHVCTMWSLRREEI